MPAYLSFAARPGRGREVERPLGDPGGRELLPEQHGRSATTVHRHHQRDLLHAGARRRPHERRRHAARTRPAAGYCVQDTEGDEHLLLHRRRRHASVDVRPIAAPAAAPRRGGTARWPKRRSTASDRSEGARATAPLRSFRSAPSQADPTCPLPIEHDMTIELSTPIKIVALVGLRSSLAAGAFVLLDAARTRPRRRRPRAAAGCRAPHVGDAQPQRVRASTATHARRPSQLGRAFRLPATHRRSAHHAAWSSRSLYAPGVSGRRRDARAGAAGAHAAHAGFVPLERPQARRSPEPSRLDAPNAFDPRRARRSTAAGHGRRRARRLRQSGSGRPGRRSTPAVSGRARPRGDARRRRVALLRCYDDPRARRSSRPRSLPPAAASRSAAARIASPPRPRRSGSSRKRCSRCSTSAATSR